MPITIEIKFLQEDVASIKFPSQEIIELRIIEVKENELSVIISNITYKAKYFFSSDKTINIWSNSFGHFKIDMKNDNFIGGFNQNKSDNSDKKKVMTQMSCKISQILVKTGDIVKVGTPLCITEAMKMEVLVYIIVSFKPFLFSKL
jgi:biotin carboxyl carrier protein